MDTLLEKPKTHSEYIAGVSIVVADVPRSASDTLIVDSRVAT